MVASSQRMKRPLCQIFSVGVNMTLPSYESLVSEAKSAILYALALAASGWAQTAAPLSLERKAEIFAYDLEQRFRIEGQVAPKLRLPVPSRSFVSYNMPDNCYMTGIYLGTEAMRWKVTGAPAARSNALAALRSLVRLHAVTGTRGLLARSYWPVDRGPYLDDGQWSTSADGRYHWRGDVSSDQVTGAMYGLSLAFDLLPEKETQAQIASLAAEVVDHILRNSRQIVGLDGKVTTWGRYDVDYVTRREPMNALLLLQHLIVAVHVTGEERFRRVYLETARRDRYAEIAVRARPPGDPLVPGAVNHSDDVLLFLAYLHLACYETSDDLRALYRQSLERTWQAVAAEQNPFFTYIYRWVTGRKEFDAAARRTLELFPLDMKWNRATLAEYEKRFVFRYDPRPVSPASPRPGVVPIDRRPKAWSAWVEDPYQAGSRLEESGMEYQGLDYLMAYWLGRHVGALE